MKIYLVYVVSIVMGLLPSVGNCSAQWQRVDKDTIKLDGDIDRNSYQSYMDIARSGYSKVILKSGGGKSMPALLIARDMHEHSPKIIVEGYCLSACANYLLLASPAPYVECGAFLMWHGSDVMNFESTIDNMRLEKRNPELIEKYRSWALKFKRMESDFYSSVGVNKKLLSDSVEVVERELGPPVSTFTFDDMTGDHSESVTAAAWVPTTKVLRAYGIDTHNFCPSYDLDIPKSLALYKISVPYTSAAP